MLVSLNSRLESNKEEREGRMSHLLNSDPGLICVHNRHTQNPLQDRRAIPAHCTEKKVQPNKFELHSDEKVLQICVPRQSLRRGFQKSISPQDSGFQKERAPILALLNEITPSNTLAWCHTVGYTGFVDPRSGVLRDQNCTT